MLCDINIVNIVLAAVVMLVLGGLFAVLLAFLGNKLRVKRDERIDEISKCLTGANCGGCGRAGCDAFATELVTGKAKVSECPSTSKENKVKIMQILGVSEELAEPTVAVVRCGGGGKCADKYEYQGYGDCNTCELLAGGRKECPAGCMGMGSCVDACPNYAIDVQDGGYAVVLAEKCTSCGLCMKACPKGLIERIPKRAAVFVACTNQCRGKDVSSFCKAGCIGCGLCAKNCDAGAIVMVDNLPVIDYSKCTACKKCVEKCPTKAIKETVQNG